MEQVWRWLSSSGRLRRATPGRAAARAHAVPIAWCASLWLLFVGLELQHLWTGVPPTQQVGRDLELLRLPRLYFCPAGTRLKWHSFECRLAYKDDRNSCPARLQFYQGGPPAHFRDRAGETGGYAACLEFGTHMVGVRAERSAAWNEIALRGSFELEGGDGGADVMQEVELGYMPTEWQNDHPKSSVKRYYYPLTRVPFFFVTPPARGPGVATRAFLAEELNHGITGTGRYFYTYGAAQIPVADASVPAQGFYMDDVQVVDWLVNDTGRRLGVVHVIITLDSFEEFEFRATSRIFLALKALGDIAGVGAVLLGLLVGHSVRNSMRAARGSAGCPRAGHTRAAADAEQGAPAMLEGL